MSSATVSRPAALPESMTSVDRAARARAALRRAQERTGTREWTVPTLAPAAHDGPVTAPHTRAGPPAEAPRRDDRRHALDAAEQLVPVDDGVRHLLPRQGLERGRTHVVRGSTGLVLALLASASRGGGWVGLVGMPEVGLLAAHQGGIDLGRVALVPDPGPDAPAVVAALLDGLDVVVVGPRAALAPGDRRRLSARARERSTVLVSTEDWAGAHLVLQVHGRRWEGPGQGEGRLRACRVLVRRTGRGGAGRPVETAAWLGEVDEALHPLRSGERPDDVVAAAVPSPAAPSADVLSLERAG